MTATTATTTKTANSPIPFVQAVTLLRDAAQREAVRQLEGMTLDPNAVAYFIEYNGRSYMATATALDLYTSTLDREEDRPGRGAAWLSIKLGDLIAPRSSSSDSFANAAAEAKREGALRVLRAMRPYLDASKLIERLS